MLLDVTVNGHTSADPTSRPATGSSGRPPPHGVYPARGEDRWVAIAVFDDDQWSGLVTALGTPSWTADPRRHPGGSVPNQDALDEHVSDWTRTATATTSWSSCSGTGAGGAVQNAEDLNERPAGRPPRRVLRDGPPVIGPARFEGTPIQFSSIAQDNWRSGPLLGEDNEYVFKQIVGVDDDEFDELRAGRRDLMTALFEHLTVIELAGIRPAR